MSKKLVMNTDIIQKFKWGGTNLEWTEEADKLANQLETMEYLNAVLTDEQKEKIIHPAANSSQDSSQASTLRSE
ncbi:MAG: hypothetical protein K0R84_2789 [Clostridia bacterium]|nr:hypothetical protein [Clostridia bacterium]